MAKRKKNKNVPQEQKENILQRNISEIATEYMKIFGMNVIIARALPEIYSGLKPVEIKILYTMFHDKKLLPNKKHTKVSAIIGPAMEKYYTHGDSVIGDVITRMGQSWNCTIPLIDKSGNFGSEYGDSAGQFRYIEARLSEYAYDCYFSEWTDGIVDMKPNYTNETVEPETLPSKYPAIIINGSYGVAYGASVSIPMFNFSEVMDLTIALIKNPKYKPCYLYPESPLGCTILGKKDYPKICEMGEGKYSMIADIVKDEKNNLHVTNVPYQSNTDKIQTEIIELRQKGKLDGVIDIRDESSGDKVDLVIVLAKNVDPEYMIRYLYKYTSLKMSYNIKFDVIVDYSRQSYNLRRLILDWVDFRRDTKRRLAANRRSICKRREYILLTILDIVLKNEKNLNKIIKICKDSKNRADTMERLIDVFQITDIQAEAIVDFKLQQLNMENRPRCEAELEAIRQKIEENYKLLTYPEVIDTEIVNELKEGKKKFGTPRKSQVIDWDDDYVSDTNHRIIFTRMSNVKKLHGNDFEGVGNMERGDYPIEILYANNRENILIFDKNGKVFNFPISKIQSSDPNNCGTHISNYIFSARVVTAMINLEELGNVKYLIFLTKNGLIKKTIFSCYTNVNYNGIAAMKLSDDDELIQVRIVSGNEDIIVFTKDGQGIRFNVADIRDTLRISKGDKAIKLDNYDTCAGFTIVHKNDNFLFMLTSKGMGKKCELSSFISDNRSGKNLILMTIIDDDYLVYASSINSDEGIAVYTKTEAITLNTADNSIPLETRISKGKKIISLKRNDNIIDVVRTF